MAGQYRFKDINGNIVAQISASSAGAISFSGSAVDFSNASTITLGQVQLAGTASNALLLDGFDSTAFVFTSSFNTISSSVSSDLLNLKSKSSSVDISISNINQFTASNGNTSLNSYTASNDTKFTTLGSYTGSNDTKWTSISNVTSSLIQVTGSYATTGSNTFVGTQIVSASMYVQGDFVVFGSSSIQYISASSVSIGTNIVQLNTNQPAVRFGGLSVQDSGSAVGVTGSMFWDGCCNRWIYSNPSGVGYSGGVLMSGPRGSTLGNEPTLTCNYIAKSGGGDHLYDSCIIDDGTTVCVNTNLKGSGTACFVGAVCSPNLIISSTCSTSGLRVYGASGTHQWDVYLNGTNIRFSDNTTGGCIVMDNPLTINTALGLLVQGSSESTIRLNNTGGGNEWRLNSYTNCNLYFQSSAGATNAVYITQAGAAVFSSYVTSTQHIAQESNSASSTQMVITNTSNASTTTKTSQLLFKISDTAGTQKNSAYVQAIPDGINVLSAHLAFGTRVSDNDSNEKMRITAGGYVGIGCTEPQSPLHIKTSNGCAIRLSYGTNSGYAAIDVDAANSLILKAYLGTEYMRITCTGNVGIGTCTPAQSLEVNGNILASSTGKIGFRYSSGDGNYYSYLRSGTAGSIGPIILGGGFESGGAANEAIRFVTNANPGERCAVSILNNGKFGIGTIAPSTQFQIRKNYWQFWDERAHGANVALFSVGIPVFGAAIVQIAGSRYSPGSDNYIGFSTIYIRTNNVGAIAVFSCDSGTYQPSYYVNGNTVNFCSPYVGSATNYTGISVSVQASGHSGGSEAAVTVSLL